MGLSARFFGFPPPDCRDAPEEASAIDRSLDYSGTVATGPRWLQWPAMHVANPGGFFWGKWTTTLRIFKTGRYFFDLDIGFSTTSTIKVDGLELRTWGQCRVARTEVECEAKHCRWAMEVGECIPDGAGGYVHRRRVVSKRLARVERAPD